MSSPIHYTVGPTQLYPTVPAHITRALEDNILSLSHRSQAFRDIYSGTAAALRELLALPESVHVLFVGSSLESMERVLENCVAEHSCHFVNGAFSEKFFQFAQKLGKQPHRYDSARGSGTRCDDDIPSACDLVCLTHNETSTGVTLHMSDIEKLKDRYPDKLTAVDIVSSAPCVDLDFGKIDAAFFSAQKGFGLPAGLGILLVNDTAVDKARGIRDRGASVGTYHDLLTLTEMEQTGETPETPNVLGIYLLGKVCRDLIAAGGRSTIKASTRQKAQYLYEHFDGHATFKPFVTDPYFRSETVIVLDTPGQAARLISEQKTCGYVIASGYGKNKADQIRIANFPAHTLADLRLWVPDIV